MKRSPHSPTSTQRSRSPLKTTSTQRSRSPFNPDDLFELPMTLSKKLKETFVCDLCGDGGAPLELLSRETLASHVDGVRHRKKEAAALGMHGVVADRGIRQMLTQTTSRKKFALRLADKLGETDQPIVGLQFIDEFLAETDPEQEEPQYECFLCPNQGGANALYTHVLSGNHRQKFFNNLFPKDPRFVNFDRRLLEKMAEEYAENKSLDQINTYQSDVLYPWTAGKAPWSIEQGGTGSPPKRLLTNRREELVTLECGPNRQRLLKAGGGDRKQLKAGGGGGGDRKQREAGGGDRKQEMPPVASFKVPEIRDWAMARENIELQIGLTEKLREFRTEKARLGIAFDDDDVAATAFDLADSVLQDIRSMIPLPGSSASSRRHGMASGSRGSGGGGGGGAGAGANGDERTVKRENNGMDYDDGH